MAWEKQPLSPSPSIEFGVGAPIRLAARIRCPPARWRLGLLCLQSRWAEAGQRRDFRRVIAQDQRSVAVKGEMMLDHPESKGDLRERTSFSLSNLRGCAVGCSPECVVRRILDTTQKAAVFFDCGLLDLLALESFPAGLLPGDLVCFAGNRCECSCLPGIC